MSYYFGFKPSEKLSMMLDDALALVDSDANNVTDDPYYILRNKTAKQIGHELIDNLLVNLIDVIPNEERQLAMRKVVDTVESSTDTLLNMLLGKDSNEEVLPNIHYLRNDTIFYDNEGNRRVGCELSPEIAKDLVKSFSFSKDTEFDRVQINKSLLELNRAVLKHFIIRFAETLPLGLIKRKSVPIAYSGIVKALEMAINRLFPQLDDAAMQRLVTFYRPFIIEKKTDD